MKPTFPATYSTLCPIALSSFISEKYKVGNVQCKFLVRGVGDTYLVESSETRFILRIYRSAHRSLPQIKEEVKLLQALKQADVSVSYPIPDISGKAILTQQAADDAYRTFLDGYRAHRPVSEQELAVVPYLSPGFWLFYMGFHTTHDQFHTFSQPAHLKSYTGILKNIVGTYWDKLMTSEISGPVV